MSIVAPAEPLETAIPITEVPFEEALSARPELPSIYVLRTSPEFTLSFSVTGKDRTSASVSSPINR